MGIEIINKEDKMFVSVDGKLSNREFLESFKNKLERIFFINKNNRKEIILDISSRELNNKEILELFDILDNENKYFISKINCLKKLKEQISIVKGDIRSGEIRVCHNSLLLVGNVNRGGKLIVEGNLYVLGKINGDIDIFDIESKIYCESIYNSFVKIGQYYKIYTYELIDQVIEVSDKKITNKKYRKEESVYGKSNCSYIW